MKESNNGVVKDESADEDNVSPSRPSDHSSSVATSSTGSGTSHLGTSPQTSNGTSPLSNSSTVNQFELSNGRKGEIHICDKLHNYIRLSCLTS